MICGDGSMIMFFLCYHGSKQRNGEMHGRNGQV